MSHFKDVLRKEARTVFLNEKEFADKMLINGQPVLAQWDDKMQPAEIGSTADEIGWGVASHHVVLFVFEDDFGCPLPGEEMDIDGERYSVIKAAPQLGITRLELERYTA